MQSRALLVYDLDGLLMIRGFDSIAMRSNEIIVDKHSKHAGLASIRVKPLSMLLHEHLNASFPCTVAI